ncbi:MAG: porin family protein [Bacteroidales bacterium]|jgi:opacity protein-like surface antigen|nr:PorT family protein [Bacteroidales bacterium]MDI9593556.1 porin family protein [Bacteroidota bacterium]NLH34300.1 PorT family protein [Lentimicrobium sp.]OQC37911.1 MAG: hypothetical protein BWX63_00703 [Bacteroidetes bacterium ADurb.Bin041]MBP7873293.1 PorT family protein [Bacteroidales bacterium]
MKNVIKLLIFVLVVSMTTGAFAQNFGLKGGLNLSNILAKDDNTTYSDDFKMNPGFHIGATAEFPFSDMFSFETGLLLSTKGYKISEEETFMGKKIEMKIKTNLFYLDIPLTAKASFDLGDAKVFGLFGPYIGMGLTGQSKTVTTIDGKTEKEKEDVEWGSEKGKSDLKRLDFGLTIGAGVEIDLFQIGLGYNLGLANISPYNDGGMKINNRVIGLSVGYKFGGK